MLQPHCARFGVLGIPIDALDLDEVVGAIDAAVADRRRMMIATVNTNFLVSSYTNAAFRSSLADADLCTVDGIGVFLVCRLLSAQVECRVSGADILERLFYRPGTAIGRPLRVFFFGGAPDVAALAKRRVDEADSPAMVCVGALNPGFGSVEDLSHPDVIAAINAAEPDVLLVALGAEKGQAWLVHNGPRLNVPVCSHFGAAIGFLGGSVRRAPRAWQAWGMEWLWRIRQEPALAGRYWYDARVLLHLLFSDILPQAAASRLRRLVLRRLAFSASVEPDGYGIILRLAGAAFGSPPESMRRCFETVRSAHLPVCLDLGKLRAVDVAIIGEIMRLRRDLAAAGDRLTLAGASPGLARSLGFV